MTENIVHLDDSNFKETTEQGVFLIDFFAEWCGPCRMLAPILEEVANSLDGKAKIGKIDIDNAQEVTIQFQVTSVPTLILLKDGKEIDRMIGLRDVETLNEMIANIL